MFGNFHQGSCKGFLEGNRRVPKHVVYGFYGYENARDGFYQSVL